MIVIKMYIAAILQHLIPYCRLLNDQHFSLVSRSPSLNPVPPNHYLKMAIRANIGRARKICADYY